MARGMFDRSLVADDMLESGGLRVPVHTVETAA